MSGVNKWAVIFAFETTGPYSRTDLESLKEDFAKTAKDNDDDIVDGSIELTYVDLTDAPKPTETPELILTDEQELAIANKWFERGLLQLRVGAKFSVVKNDVRHLVFNESNDIEIPFFKGNDTEEEDGE